MIALLPVLTAALLAAAESPGGVVVVLPPEGLVRRGESPWVGEAVADALPRALARLGVPVVERAERLRAQEALDIPPIPLTRATSVRIAEALGAARLVVGSYESKEKTLDLSLRILDVEQGTLSSPFWASGPVESACEMIHGLAWDIALSGPTKPSLTRADLLARCQSVPFKAFEAYAKGLSAADAASRMKQIKKALALSPTYDEARLTLGRSEMQAREYAAAQQTLVKVAPASPLARPARFLQGVALLELGRYREAASLYAVLMNEEATPASLNNHALSLLRLAGPGLRASDVLRKALDLSPGSRDIAFNLGFALLAEGDAEASAFWLHGLARDRPDDAHARVVLSWALRKAGRADEAEGEWRAVVARAPSYQSLAVQDLGLRFERIMDSERPLLTERVGRSGAELAAAHLGRAEKLTESDPDGALRELTRAAYLDPYGARVHQRLGQALVRQGDKEKGLSEFNMSLWCRDDPAVRLELALVLRDLGRTAEAVAEAQRILKADPGHEAAQKLIESLSKDEGVR